VKWLNLAKLAASHDFRLGNKKIQCVGVSSLLHQKHQCNYLATCNIRVTFSFD